MKTCFWLLLQRLIFNDFLYHQVNERLVCIIRNAFAALKLSSNFVVAIGKSADLAPSAANAGSLEEADAHIQAGSCQAREHDHAETANYSDHIQNVDVGSRFRNGRRGNF